MKISFAALAIYAAAQFQFLCVPTAHADGFAAKSTASARGSHGAAARRQGVVADGQGNVVGASQRGFATDSGAYGGRSSRFSRSSDGSFNASTRAGASGANGSAQTSGNFTRNSDGTASGERSTTATNANTGVTYDASTTYTKDTGFSRSALCKDAAGNSVSCGSR